MAPLAGIHHVKFPVTDLEESRIWFERVYGLTLQMEFRDDDDGPVMGVAFEPLDGAYITLRQNPAVAAGIAGFDPVSFAVADREALDVWIEHLDALGIDHSPAIDATIGWLVVFRDLDGIEHHLYTLESHGIDRSGRAGYGQTVAVTDEP
jgi:catechol 2,3-dioxygenase-like lactoylglutathione lyase family enzyme